MQKFTCLPGEKMKNPSICAKVNKKTHPLEKKVRLQKSLVLYELEAHVREWFFFLFRNWEIGKKTAKENSTRASEENLLFDRLHTGKSLQAAASAAIRLVKKVGEKWEKNCLKLRKLKSFFCTLSIFCKIEFLSSTRLARTGEERRILQRWTNFVVEWEIINITLLIY